MVSDKTAIYNTIFGLAIVISTCNEEKWMKVKLLDPARQNFVSGEYPEWGPGYACISCIGLGLSDQIDLIGLIKLRLCHGY